MKVLKLSIEHLVFGIAFCLVAIVFQKYPSFMNVEYMYKHDNDHISSDQVEPTDKDKIIRVVIADDHTLMTEGLRDLLELQPDMEVVGAVHDGDQLIDFLEEHADVHVAVVDVQMPYDGLKALSQLRQRGCRTYILLLTAYANKETVQSALRLGAEGFALKTDAPSKTIDAIRQVSQGKLVFPAVAHRWLAQGFDEPFDVKLSQREEDVLKQLAGGLSNTEIATALTVSENTVRFHLKNIYTKLNVSNRTEAASWFFRHSRGKS